MVQSGRGGQEWEEDFHISDMMRVCKVLGIVEDDQEDNTALTSAVKKRIGELSAHPEQLAQLMATSDQRPNFDEEKDGPMKLVRELVKREAMQRMATQGFQGDLKVEIIERITSPDVSAIIYFAGNVVKIDTGNHGVYSWTIDEKALAYGWTLSYIVKLQVGIPSTADLDLLDWVVMERLAKIKTPESIKWRQEHIPLRIYFTEFSLLKGQVDAVRKKIYPQSLSMLI